jgi:hypothetical protein
VANIVTEWGVKPYSAAVQTLRSIRINNLVVEWNHRDELDVIEDHLLATQKAVADALQNNSLSP